ncbi:MAG: cyclic nucleotide-binding domain-containing protein [Treponema sp.]|nr:cyclic nucleotide-binding domain-containing protein [Treponema sp.]
MKTLIPKIPFEEALPRLANIGLFNDFSENNEEDVEMFRKLYEKFTAESYDDNDLIVKEGDKGDNLYILNEGAVQIFRTTQYGDEIAIADLDDSFDVFFGEAALIEDDERSATVRAIGKCRVLVLKGTDFIDFCKVYPILGFYTYKKIMKRMQQTRKRAHNDIATLYAALFREIEGTD